jgi:hypothetical protein
MYAENGLFRDGYVVFGHGQLRTTGRSTSSLRFAF